jgi:ubiquinone/menaquinone biosynthesis C-methylase UbiE
MSSTDNDVSAYYERVAKSEGLAREYGEATPIGEFYRDRMRRISRLLERADGDLLDAGCGTGQMLRFLHDAAAGRFALTGLDRSATNIAVARRVADDEAIRLVVGRIEALPFPDASFDVVLAMGSLEYVASLDGAIGELARVTRPGGIAVVTMQNRWSPYRLWEATVWAPVRRRLGAGESPLVRRVSSRQLRVALAAAGLAPESVARFGFDLFLPPLDRRFPLQAIDLQRRLDRILRGPLRAVGTDYLVQARRTTAGA